MLFHNGAIILKPSYSKFVSSAVKTSESTLTHNCKTFGGEGHFGEVCNMSVRVER